MITKFENFNLITENPDIIRFKDEDDWADSYDWVDDGTKPFYCIVNEDHTKVERLYVGHFSKTHDDIKFVKKDDDRYRQEIVSYPGRVWTKEKIMSFWVYPNEKLFVSIIKNLEKIEKKNV